MFLIKMSVQERSETKHGAKMKPTWHQNGFQNGAQIDEKSVQKSIIFLMLFEIGFLKDSGRFLDPTSDGVPPLASILKGCWPHFVAKFWPSAVAGSPLCGALDIFVLHA